jgi:hypothetical protein
LKGSFGFLLNQIHLLNGLGPGERVSLHQEKLPRKRVINFLYGEFVVLPDFFVVNVIDLLIAAWIVVLFFGIIFHHQAVVYITQLVLEL